MPVSRANVLLNNMVLRGASSLSAWPTMDPSAIIGGKLGWRCIRMQTVVPVQQEGVRHTAGAWLCVHRHYASICNTNAKTEEPPCTGIGRPRIWWSKNILVFACLQEPRACAGFLILGRLFERVNVQIFSCSVHTEEGFFVTAASLFHIIQRPLFGASGVCDHNRNMSPVQFHETHMPKHELTRCRRRTYHSIRVQQWHQGTTRAYGGSVNATALAIHARVTLYLLRRWNRRP